MDEKTTAKLLHMLYEFCYNFDNCADCPNRDECDELSGNVPLYKFMDKLEDEE